MFELLPSAGGSDKLQLHKLQLEAAKCAEIFVSSVVSEDVCRRLQAGALPRLHHRPLPGVPPPRGSETISQHAAVHLRDPVQEGRSCLFHLCLILIYFCTLSLSADRRRKCSAATFGFLNI